MNGTQASGARIPGVGQGLRYAMRSAVRRPALFLGILYAVAICFEQAVEVEVFKPYRLVGGVLILLMLLRGRLKIDRFAKLAIAFIATGFVVGLGHSLFRSGGFSILFITLLLWAFNILTYVALVTLLRDRRDLAVVAVVHAVAMLFAAYGISGTSIGDVDVSGRQFGDFKNPANACVSMLFSTIVLLSVLRSGRSRSLPGAVIRVLAMVGIVIFMLYTSTLTGSRAGAALLLVGVLVHFALTVKRSFAVVATFAAGLVLLAALFASVKVPNYGESISDTNVLAQRIERKGLDTDRLYLWRAGFDAFLDSYGLGLGMMGYRTVHKEYFARYAARSDPRWMDSDLTLHSDYVSAVVEYGFIGLILFGLMCRRLVQMAKAVPERPVGAIAIAMLAGIAINGLTHTGLPYFAVWFYFALLSAWVMAGRVAHAGKPGDVPVAARAPRWAA